MPKNVYIISKNQHLKKRLSTQIVVSNPELYVHDFNFIGDMKGVVKYSENVVIYDSVSLGVIPKNMISFEGGRWLNLSKLVNVNVEMQSLVDGFSGLVDINTPIEKIPKIIRSLQQGQIWFSRRVTSFAIRQYQNKSLTSEEMVKFAIDHLQLTQREKELTRLLVRGESNQDIARYLSISIHTVKTHVSRILNKLGVHSRYDLHGALCQDVHSDLSEEFFKSNGLALPANCKFENQDIVSNSKNYDS